MVDSFELNLLRFLAAQLYFSLGVTAAREMFGKSYFALGADEKVAVDNTVRFHVSANYQSLTPEFLAARMTSQEAGFSAQQRTVTSPER